jgi:hypothetical protein
LTDDTAALRLQVARQVAHWRAATAGLQDLENFASPAAWRTLERYLDVAVRGHLSEAVDRLERQGDVLAAELRAAFSLRQLEEVRLHVIEFRRRYLQVETAREL